MQHHHLVTCTARCTFTCLKVKPSPQERISSGPWSCVGRYTNRTLDTHGTQPAMTKSGLDGAVTFCVGGSFFTTLRDTLMREPSCRLALISRKLIPSSQDAQGVFFIDRDPKYFQLMLNFLRDGWCLLPSTSEERMELLHELGGMEAWIRSQELVSGSTSGLSPRAALPTVAYTGSPSRSVYGTPDAAAAKAAAFSSPARSSPWSPGPVGSWSQPSASAAASPGPAVGLGSGRPHAGEQEHPMRAVFLNATAAGPAPAATPAYSIPQVDNSSKVKWTAKYLRTNEGLREVANTLMGLAYMPPHRLLHAGKVSLRITSDCVHDRVASLLSAEPSSKPRVQAPQVVSVRSTAGWSFEMVLRPGSSDAELCDKCNIAEFVQDNWFVLSAVLKDQFGVVLEEDTAVGRPSCLACRKVHLAVSLSKIY